MVLFHGISDHGGWLLFNVATQLVKLVDCAVIVHDQPGHGRSDGLHVYIPDWHEFVDDSMDFIENFAVPKRDEWGSSLKLFGWGESMGGGVLTTLCIRKPEMFAGVVLSAVSRLVQQLEPFPAPLSWMPDEPPFLYARSLDAMSDFRLGDHTAATKREIPRPESATKCRHGQHTEILHCDPESEISQTLNSEQSADDCRLRQYEAAMDSFADSEGLCGTPPANLAHYAIQGVPKP